MIYRNIKKAIFGFSDKKTGEKLRKFFKKHTGKDIDFNSIEHYSENFKLLAFDIPLKDFIPIGITAALVCSGLKFHGPVEEFISWYENKYLIFKDVEIIKHIPHASVEFPNIYKGVEHLVFGKNYKRDNYKMSDLFVDELFSNIPGVEVKAKYSRLYCDVEKYKDNSKEEMARFGQGYIYTKNYLGEEYIRHKKINKVDIVMIRNTELMGAIQEIYDYNKGRYGVRRIHKELSNKGYHVNHKRVQRLMHEMRLFGKEGL